MAGRILIAIFRTYGGKVSGSESRLKGRTKLFVPFRKSVLRYILEGQGVDQALDAPVERIER